MTKLHIRIIASLLAFAVLAATVLGGAWMYKEQFKPESERKKTIETLMKKEGPKVDPGKKVYEQALKFIRQGEPNAARTNLNEILEVHRDSSRYKAARRLAGEVNMDQLYARTPMPGKLEYTVGRTRQDNLNSIAIRFRTTVPFIKRVNHLLGPVIHPGDRLVLYPLDFEVEVDVAGRTFTLSREGRFFKSYTILDHSLPAPTLPARTYIGAVGGWLEGKGVRPDDERFALARKYLQTTSTGVRPGVYFCEAPQESQNGTEKPATPGGIYLAAEDIEELATILRPGIPLKRKS